MVKEFIVIELKVVRCVEHLSEAVEVTASPEQRGNTMDDTLSVRDHLVLQAGAAIIAQRNRRFLLVIRNEARGESLDRHPEQLAVVLGRLSRPICSSWAFASPRYLPETHPTPPPITRAGCG